MDRRSLFAIVLTIAVLLAWNFFYIAPKQKTLRERRAEQLREMRMADSLEAAAEPSPEDTPGARYETETVAETTEEPVDYTGVTLDVGEEVTITVVTGTVRAELSSRGGEVRSLKLLDYYRKDGELVELVPDGAGGGFALSLMESGGGTGLSNTVFKVFLDGVLIEEGTEIVLGEQKEETRLAFRLEGEEGELLEKRFTFYRGGYEVGLGVTLKREGELRKTQSYAISWDCGLAVTEKDARGDMRQFAALGMVGEEFYKESMGKFSKADLKEHDGMVLWAGSRTKYFLSALIPEKQREGTLMMKGNKEENLIGYGVGYRFRGDPREVDDSFVCYMGPLDMNTLKGYGIGLEKTIDLGRLRFFSALVLRLMMFLRRFIPNYGVVIIILSVMTKVLFYRLTHKSFKSMKDMQRLQPKIKELQEKYKDSKEKLNQEMMKLYKEAGVNPLGGCLPLLLQLPVFIALFNVLRNTIELRGAPFALWISDLSSPDVLFSFGARLPFLGNEFHLMPILMGIAMYAQSKLGGSPTGGEAPAGQTKMMTTMMPIVFTVLFYSVPSGLVLYWLINNVLSIVQQYYIHKKGENEEKGVDSIESTDAKVETGTAPGNDAAGGKGKRRSKPGKGAGRSRKSKRRPYH